MRKRISGDLGRTKTTASGATPKTPKARNVAGEAAALKKERILAAAVSLFYDHGYEKTTLDTIAEKLRMTKPYIYTYYDSKAQLLGTVCERAISASLLVIDKILNSSGSSTERMREFSKAFTIAVIENQKYIAIFTREEKNLSSADVNRINAMRREFDVKLNVLLQQGIGEGAFAFPDRELAALAIGGIVSWVHVWYRSNGRLDKDALSDRFATLVLTLTGANRTSTIKQRQPNSA